MTIIILSNGYKVPVEGYTIERACEILLEAGHLPVRVQFSDGTTRTLKPEAA